MAYVHVHEHVIAYDEHVFELVQPVFRVTEVSCVSLCLFYCFGLMWKSSTASITHEHRERELPPPHPHPQRLQRSALTPHVKASSMNLASTHKREHTGYGKAGKHWR